MALNSDVTSASLVSPFTGTAVALPCPSSAKRGSQTRRKYKRMHSLNLTLKCLNLPPFPTPDHRQVFCDLLVPTQPLNSSRGGGVGSEKRHSDES